MSDHAPKISIGMPVRNGERFLRRALDSIQSQTYEDLEVVICDNASEDATEEICREYVARDRRFRYFRNATNLGAAANYNRTLELSRGTFFKWAAHDDWIDQSYLRRCLEMLEDHPQAVLCFSAHARVDGEGMVTEIAKDRLELQRLSSPDARVRFRAILWHLKDPHPVFGLMRADAARRTGGIRNAPEPDRIFLGELSLIGPMLRIPEPLFYGRRPGGSQERARLPKHHAWRWLSPANRRWLRLATFRIIAHHLVALRGAPLSGITKLHLAFQVLVAFAVRRTFWKITRKRTGARRFRRLGVRGTAAERTRA